jgi:hypothetical protein
MRELTLLGRRGCDLCDELAEALAPLLAGRAVPLRLLDVDADPTLVRRYGLHVPVLLADGAVLCAHRLDRERVVAALAGERWEPLELG